ncbi:MAG: preprotein translocase subunit SecE [Clostridia bacterium]|nr:preprotein translocase subunit SecE [Clostridia bacterium]
MKTGALLKRWAVAFLAVVLMISLFAMPVCAEETTGETTAETTAETTGEVGTEAETKADSSDSKNEKKGLDAGAIVGISIAAVLVIAIVVLGVKFRENIKKFLRVCKSETKKIVWLSWDQTKKNSLVVLIVLIVCAAVICLLDYALQQGFLAFIGLF